MPALGTLQKLRSHPSARLQDDLPPVSLVVRYVILSPSDEGHITPHLFWVERRPNRGFDAEGQATFRWRERTYNVARVLLQHRLKHRVVRAVNTCGLPQCVKSDHWSIEPAFLGAVSSSSAFATVRVRGAWRLAKAGVIVERDVVFVAAAAPHAGRHVVRALREDNETVFLSVCGLEIDPSGVVAGGTATCLGCVS